MTFKTVRAFGNCLTPIARRFIVGLIKKSRINPAEAANSLLQQASLFQPGDSSPGIAHELPNALTVSKFCVSRTE